MKHLALFFISAAMISCGSSSSTNSNSEGVSDSTGDTLQTAVAQAGAEGGTTEGGSVHFAGEDFEAMNGVIESLKDDVGGLSACSYSTNRTCSGSGASTVGTIAWNSCTVGTATMTGGWSEAFSATGCCATFGDTCSVTRTSSGSTITAASGANVTTSTTAHSAYDGTLISGSGTTISRASGVRTINMQGIHRVLKGPGGTTWFDHSIVTTTPIAMQGTRAGNNRIINSGVIKIYHNRAKYTATNTFDTTNKVTWGVSTCCFPTAGLVTTTLSGSLTGTVSLQFTSTCGQATYTDTGGTTSTITMNAYQCQ